MKRSKKKKKKRKFQFSKGRICLNCGEVGSHFVPPCLGDKGFFICKTKERKEKGK